jgi:hypothetical protein
MAIMRQMAVALGVGIIMLLLLLGCWEQRGRAVAVASRPDDATSRSKRRSDVCNRSCEWIWCSEGCGQGLL